MEKQGGPSFQLRTALVSIRDADASQWNVHYVLHIEKKKIKAPEMRMLVSVI